MEKKKRVFLSYSYEDKRKVDEVVRDLHNSGIDVFKDYEIPYGSSWQRAIKYSIETSETVLIFFSDNFSNSNWANEELSMTLKELNKRKITVLFILLEKTHVPSDLLGFEFISLATNFEEGIEKIIKKLKVIPDIAFDNFDGNRFENLVIDLLKEYQFKDVQKRNESKDGGIDVVAEFEYKNPFGFAQQEYWIVQVKFYRQDRFSVSAIQQLLSFRDKMPLSGNPLNILLVTNSMLTSAAQEYLDHAKKNEYFRVEVIDGAALKLLISKRKRLLDKYFKA